MRACTGFGAHRRHRRATEHITSSKRVPGILTSQFVSPAGEPSRTGSVAVRVTPVVRRVHQRLLQVLGAIRVQPHHPLGMSVPLGHLPDIGTRIPFTQRGKRGVMRGGDTNGVVGHTWLPVGQLLVRSRFRR
jgi:hypothetical protein